HYKPIKNIRKSMWYAYLEVLGLENLTKIDIFDNESKIKNKHEENYRRLKEVIKFNSKSLILLKNFLGQFAENNQKTKLKIF
ncbi:hypothetical protein H8684_06925, partial [Helicobacter pylori]|nr:hypothetical protein [Helicobacter pylori]